MTLIGLAVGYISGATWGNASITLLVYGSVGAVVGASVGTTIFGALESGVAMVFVCLADDPATLLVHYEVSLANVLVDAVVVACMFVKP